MEAYLYTEGLARFCTVDYEEPTAENKEKFFMHLTNFSLNKHSEDFVFDDEDFLTKGGDSYASKRLLSQLFTLFEEYRIDITFIKMEIIKIARKVSPLFLTP